MKKILHILAIKPRGGVGTFLKNIYRDKFFYEFDILESGTEIGGNFDEFFLQRNSDIFLFPEIKYKNIIKYFFKCKNFYKTNARKYSAIHIHSTAIAYFHLYFAKKYGINVRIFHSHGNFSNENVLKKFINRFFLSQILKLSSYFCACGLEAGEILFGNRDFTIVPNGIDVENFSFDKEKRDLIRNSLNLKNEKLVGIIGRFDENKNQKFILELAKKMRTDKTVKFIFFGDGNLLSNCIDIKEKNSLDNVIFMGNVTNIYDYYNALDILTMPSIKEGFSLVAIEGQCNGIPIIFSDSLPRSMKILGSSKFISTNLESLYLWEKYIKDYDFKEDRVYASKIVSKNFSIENSRNILKKVYDNLLGE